MNQPVTRPSLLLRIRDSRDQEAWSQFAEIYTPLVYELCSRRGLQQADALDIAQEVMLAVARAIAGFEYDPARGTFRGWLYRLARNKLADHLARRRDEVKVHGGTAAQQIIDNMSGPGEDEEEWNKAHRERLLAWASEKARGEFSDRIWQVFWETAVHRKSAAEVAQSFSMSLGAVYTAKSRVIARLRKLIEEATGEECLMDHLN